MVHMITHLLRLPDTLQPDTIASILMLAASTRAVTAIGTKGDLFLHWLFSGGSDDAKQAVRYMSDMDDRLA